MIGIWGINSKLREKTDYLNSEDVLAEIIDRPFNCEDISSKGGIIKVQYNNQVFVIGISRGQCEKLPELENDMIKVKLSPDKKRMFFIDGLENFSEQIVASSIILIVGFFCLIRSRK